jgi:hypothetical protein
MSRTLRIVKMPDAEGNLSPQRRREESSRWQDARAARVERRLRRECSENAIDRQERATDRRLRRATPSVAELGNERHERASDRGFSWLTGATMSAAA